MKTIKQTIQAILSVEDLSLDVNPESSFKSNLEQVDGRCFEVLGDLEGLIGEFNSSDEEVVDIVEECSLYELLGVIKSKTQDECSEDDDFNDYLTLKQEALSIYKDNQEVISFINSPLF